MIDIVQLRTLIVRPVLEYLDAWSAAAENLIIGTAIQESKVTYIKQLGTGPAVGIYQMEPNTYNDLWKNYVAYRPTLMTQLRSLSVTRIDDKPFIGNIPANQMIGNLYYATAMCRVLYKRVPAKLPPAGDVNALGEYWKIYYNTYQGSGTSAEFVANYLKFNKNAS
jgi:hypothetical protein